MTVYRVPFRCTVTGIDEPLLGELTWTAADPYYVAMRFPRGGVWPLSWDVLNRGLTEPAGDAGIADVCLRPAGDVAGIEHHEVTLRNGSATAVLHIPTGVLQRLADTVTPVWTRQAIDDELAALSPADFAAQGRRR